MGCITTGTFDIHLVHTDTQLKILRIFYLEEQAVIIEAHASALKIVIISKLDQTCMSA